MNNKPTIALFGTCGGSTWREDKIIPYFEEHNINYYNPVVSNWTPECAIDEAKHLANDEIILFVINEETSGMASLMEAMCACVRAVSTKQQKVLLYICKNVSKECEEKEPYVFETSNRCRVLALEHMDKFTEIDNIIIANSYEELLELSHSTYNVMKECIENKIKE